MTNIKEHITFYEVPLVCGAAPHIGCGSRAKPVLSELGSNKQFVSEAWLIRTGTVIAIVWNEESSTKTRAAFAESVFSNNGMRAERASDKKYERLLKKFQNKNIWYQGEDINKLSMEEADVIAERLVTRINSKTPLTNEKSKVLKKEFSDMFKSRLIKNYGSGINRNEEKLIKTLKQKTEEELPAVAKKYLNETEMTALKNAIALGLRPIENES